ncbi:hypothetical protein E1A91_D06G165100v1, partial [Gossypium mustelinum]
RRRKGKPKTKESPSKSTLTQDNASRLINPPIYGLSLFQDWSSELHSRICQRKSPPRHKLTLETHKCKCPKSFRVISHLN